MKMNFMVFGAPDWLRARHPKLLPEDVRAERLDDALRNCREIAESGHHGHALKNINVAERYMAGHLYVRVISTPLDSPVLPEIRYYNAFLKVARAGNYQPNLSISDDEVLHDARGPICAYRNQVAMLVNVAQAADGPEVVVPSIVGLKIDNHLLNVSRDSDELSLLSLSGLRFPFNIFSAPAEGKVNVPNIFAPGAAGDGNHELVEARTQVIDSFGDQDEQAVRYTASELDFGQAVARLRLRLDDKGVSVAIEEQSDFHFDLIDVRIGAINLEARTTEGVTFDARKNV